MREVGALPDAKAVHGGRSAYNHLLCLAQTNNLPRRRVGEVLELVGLSEVARKRTEGFSLGMGQRLGIAGTLLGDPAVLMFDEPINGWTRTSLIAMPRRIVLYVAKAVAFAAVALAVSLATAFTAFFLGQALLARLAP